jgi:hypothetical protein
MVEKKPLINPFISSTSRQLNHKGNREEENKKLRRHCICDRKPAVE